MFKLRINDFKVDLEGDLLKLDLENCGWGLIIELERIRVEMEDNYFL